MLVTVVGQLALIYVLARGLQRYPLFPYRKPSRLERRAFWLDFARKLLMFVALMAILVWASILVSRLADLLDCGYKFQLEKTFDSETPLECE